MFCAYLARRLSIPLAGLLTMLGLLWGLFPTPEAHAQGIPFLLRDINTTATDHHGSMPRTAAAIGKTVYYTASDPIFGAELWKSDGTAAGTFMVRDLWPGIGSSTPIQLTAAGSTLFFAANDGAHGQELWRSDGTTAGTWMVKDIYWGQGSSVIRDMVALNNKVFFLASDGIHERALWCSDGSAAGTRLVMDPVTLDCHFPYGLTVVNQAIFFLGYSRGNGYAFALFKSDGTPAGTALVKASVTHSSATMLWSANGRVYFDGYGFNFDLQLGSSDGTAAGTGSIMSASSPDYIVSLAALNGATYFVSQNSLTSMTLWKTDGTSPGTLRVKTIYAKAAPYSQSLFNRAGTPLIEAGGKLYFYAQGQTDGMELWRSDGTAAGTMRVKDINPGSKGSYPTSLTNVGGKLYFFADDGIHGMELWKSDGSAGGTVMIKDANPGKAGSLGGSYAEWDFPENQIVPLAGGTNGLALVAANDGVHGAELWKTDGTLAGTRLVRDAASGSDSLPASMTACGRSLFFTADDAKHGRELWVSNGTIAGTRLVLDICRGPVGGLDLNREPYVFFSPTSVYPAPVNTTRLVNMGGAAYFAANDGVHGLALYRSDGTATGTYALKDRLPSLVALTAAGRNVFFLTILDEPTSTGQSIRHTIELWRSDGTKTGTRLLKRTQFSDYSNYGRSYDDSHMVAVGAMVYLTIPDTMGAGLWKSDGTVAGTVMIAPSFVDQGALWPESLTPAGGRVFFTANQNLWVTDGTLAGTKPVSGTTPNGVLIKSLTSLNGKLIYVSYDHPHGEELWVSDGTTPGTHILKDLWPGLEGSRPENLTVVGNRLFFSAADYDHGRELWVTDGTAAGTQVVRDICSGWVGSRPANLAAMGNVVLFSAYDWLHGDELWMSNGTAAGTRLVYDLMPGKKGSNPQDLAVVGNMLFFTAVNGNNQKQGRELWGWKALTPLR